MDTQKLYFSATYARLLARSGRSDAGICGLAELLANTGLDVQGLQATEYLDWAVVRQMLVNIDASGAPRDWPVRFAQTLTLAGHGPMGFTALSAPTLGRALEVMVNYHPTRIATLQVGMEQSADETGVQFITVRELTGDDVYGHQVMEIALQVALSLIEALVGHELGSNVELHFACSRGQHGATLEKAFGVRCHFDCERNCIAIPSSWLYIASPLYDEASYHANLKKCREQMSSLLTMQANTVEWLRQRLAQNFDQALADRAVETIVPDLATCAAALHMSQRTLSRKLARHDASYSAILADVRREYALQLLASSYLSTGEIAGLLGYADPANFIRAFRSWCHCTPQDWRRQSRRPASNAGYA
ncbi:MAG: AraC family transcriptional regulator ligand-binding domain-containing protein [Pseudomonadales bacterium]